MVSPEIFARYIASSEVHVEQLIVSVWIGGLHTSVRNKTGLAAREGGAHKFISQDTTGGRGPDDVLGSVESC